MRRLPIFLVLDVSESMVGDNLRQLQEGLERLAASLRTDPHALETVFLSTIVFAGKARTLTPLTELGSYYPPRLPVGSGTSLGVAMNHLMDEIDRSVQTSTPDKKGDFRPVVYLLTDGKPTDDCEQAIKRWKERFANRATLVAIGIGKHAAIQTLQRFTENVLMLDANTEADFKRFVDWVSMSVVAQSRRVTETTGAGVSLAKLDPDIMKKITDLEKSIALDEDLVVLSGLCQANKLPYLMKYEKMHQKVGNPDFNLDVDLFNLTGVFALEKDYFDLSDNRAMTRTVNTDALIGAPGCPHCGNVTAFAMCGCGQIMCYRGNGEAVCPGCNKTITFNTANSDEGGFDVTRSRG